MPKSGSEVKAVEVLSEEYAQGLRCPRCRIRRDGRGCLCDRQRLFKDDSAVIADWLDSLPADLRGKKRGRLSMVDDAALSALHREIRRAPLEPDERAEHRTVVNDVAGIAAKWHPPRTLIRKRAFSEPL